MNRKIDQLKAILDSQVPDPEEWPIITTEILEDEDGLSLNVQSEQVGFSFDKTGEHFVGIVNWKD